MIVINQDKSLTISQNETRTVSVASGYSKIGSLSLNQI